MSARQADGCLLVVPAWEVGSISDRGALFSNSVSGRQQMTTIRSNFKRTRMPLPVVFARQSDRSDRACTCDVFVASAANSVPLKGVFDAGW